MAQKNKQTIAQLHGSLKEYIEATYHIGDAKCIEQRRTLFERVGQTHQIPYLESTPKYLTGKKFADIAGIPAGAATIYSALSTTGGRHKRLLFDPPHTHPRAATHHALNAQRNIVILPGRGQGSTQSFLLTAHAQQDPDE